MKLDLRKDQKSLIKYIKERIKNYPVYVNAGPGEDEDPITQITLGYQFDQAGWAAMVFDTRNDAEVDGEWQGYIEENVIPFEHWMDASETLCEDQPVSMTRPDGSKQTLNSYDELAEVLGLFLRDILVGCRNDGLFKKLPCVDDCRLTIEEHDGQYGWTDPDRDDDDEMGDDPFAVNDELKARVSKMSKAKQIAFWIDRLKQIAADTKKDPDDYDYDTDGNVEALAEIGTDAVVPMLKLAVDLAGKSPFQGDKGEDGYFELYRSKIMELVFWAVEDMEHATPEIEKLLRQIVTKAVKANSKRKMKGAGAFFAARALFNLFDSYPCPELGDADNALVDPKPFIGK